MFSDFEMNLIKYLISKRNLKLIIQVFSWFSLNYFKYLVLLFLNKTFQLVIKIKTKRYIFYNLKKKKFIINLLRSYVCIIYKFRH